MMNIGMEIDRTEKTPAGRDPREMTRGELESLGHGKSPMLKIIRARCMDCCGEQQSEVRRCPSVKCANWPYRMGTNPWSDRTGNVGALDGARRKNSSAIQASISEVEQPR